MSPTTQWIDTRTDILSSRKIVHLVQQISHLKRIVSLVDKCEKEHGNMFIKDMLVIWIKLCGIRVLNQTCEKLMLTNNPLMISSQLPCRVNTWILRMSSTIKFGKFVTIA